MSSDRWWLRLFNPVFSRAVSSPQGASTPAAGLCTPSPCQGGPEPGITDGGGQSPSTWPPGGRSVVLFTPSSARSHDHRIPLRPSFPYFLLIPYPASLCFSLISPESTSFNITCTRILVSGSALNKSNLRHRDWHGSP